MLDAMPEIFDFVKNVCLQYWKIVLGSSVLAGFFSLRVLDRLFNIFDILKR